MSEAASSVNEDQTQPDWFGQLIVVASNFKLLLLGPITAALIAYGVCFFVPQRYVSLAIVALPPQPLPISTLTLPIQQSPAQAAAMMTSPLVLDPIVRSLNPGDGRVVERDRSKLAESIKVTVGKDLLLRLEVTALTPTQAQSIAKSVIEGWRKTTVPGDSERVDLEKRLDHMKTSLAMVTKLLEKTADEGLVALNKPLTRGEASAGLVGLGELQARFLSEVLSIPRALRGFSMDVVVQSPTLPIESVWPKKWLVSLLAGLLALLALLVWVFGVQKWAMFKRKPGAADKINGLKQALRISKNEV